MIFIFFYGIVFFLGMAYLCYKSNEHSVMPLFVIGSFASTLAFISSSLHSICYIRLHESFLECVIPCKKIALVYSQCTVGMDYSLLRGNKVWWIYLCYGASPKYEFKNPKNRINALKCKEGFVRILYREDIYEELLKVLPKKQAAALTTAKRYLSD